jgi:hypothetical protein
MDTSTFAPLIAHLGTDDLPRLLRLLDEFLGARESAAALWADREAHFNGRMNAALATLHTARWPVTALVPNLPERWAGLRSLGPFPPAGAPSLDDAGAQELNAFREFVAKQAGDVPQEQYVTLDQAAALVNRCKKTLERRVNRHGSEAPPPDVLGGGGRPHEWRWSTLRPWLERAYGRQLPERIPSRARRG